jgi:hypothetical protein
MKKRQNMLEISPQYLVDKSGKKVSVLLDIVTFEQMVELYENLCCGNLAKKALKDNEYIEF